jgi:hypothetical protein
MYFGAVQKFSDVTVVMVLQCVSIVSRIAVCKGLAAENVEVGTRDLGDCRHGRAVTYVY